MQLTALPLIEALFSEVNPIPVKEALNMKGFNFGTPRLPLVKITEPNRLVLKNKMTEFDSQN